MMKKINSNEIRSIWLSFFKNKDHLILPSYSLIPNNDKSLLWINSGVATIKSYFDGSEKPPYPRLTSSQKSLRTGDIENVGQTTRHHTFFEMLGNFSIGDYFKKEAINMAWELLTSKEWFAIEKDLLFITVFKDDEESLNYWLDLGINKDHIFVMDRDTNFWDMGKGPCGPSSEIFFDKGSEYDSREAKELILNDIENDRYVEIWNIVFSEFNNDGNGSYKELPQKNIDTGAGLERLASIFQETPTNFETDLFKPLIEHINSKTDNNYTWEYIPEKLKEENPEQFIINAHYKSIVDFIRAASFAISDGAIPGPNGRGYVIRKLIRKAVVNKIKLRININCLYELVEPLITIMGEQYPLLKKEKSAIIRIIKNEEEQFNKTLLDVEKKLQVALKDNSLDEKFAFKLHETYGLPMDTLKELSKNSDIKLDWKKIKQLEEEFKAKSKSSKSSADAMNIQDEEFVGLGETDFVGRENFSATGKVISVQGDRVVFDKTPFYATAGGQESDFGFADDFVVSYVQKNAEDTFIHEIKGNNFKKGDEVSLNINLDRRNNLTINHSAAHLLFRAIEMILNKQIEQVGSKIEESFLRFDFPSHEKITDGDLKQIENLVNDWILAGTKSETIVTDNKTAKKMAISRVDGHDYGDKVRVVKLNDDVIDLCAGTHVKNTSEIELLKIIKFEKKGSGVYRIEAIAGKDSIKRVFKEINTAWKQEIINPIQSKIKNTNDKLNELGIKEKINFDKEINELDLSSSDFKKSVNALTEKINKNILKIAKEMFVELETQYKKELSKDIVFIKEYKNFSSQEVVKPMLNLINNKKSKMAIIITSKKDKVTYSFVLSKDNINEEIINNIKNICNKYNLRGNGKNQLYIFGGIKFDNKEMIEEIKTWEF